MRWHVVAVDFAPPGEDNEQAIEMQKTPRSAEAGEAHDYRDLARGQRPVSVFPP